MLRFVLDVLLLRNLIQSRTARMLFLIFILGALVAGCIYAFVVFQAISERSNSSHVSTYRPH
ncbi:hypothetical protein AciX9_3182 [Granulicella tundricola MP5ACTX9]|uniref:Uncharacterized protein n=1 Tax=Granulicella tundricola (strain ATCC BAA-1859 / DSM 23138 / MP5ACTX9) TaxID=1198114 RepID=E8X1F8_GRATM|nr:hypothetical protein AciX9_3182 [Granulicella tundricola MP5ACTX9]